jgi:hypothetical protein
MKITVSELEFQDLKAVAARFGLMTTTYAKICIFKGHARACIYGLENPKGEQLALFLTEGKK